MTEAQQTWREPDADMIRRAMSRLGALQHRRVFYEKLENPSWVDALDREGVFNSPPEVVVNEDGTAHSAPWPEGGYLIRMASSVPGPVARILLPHKISSGTHACWADTSEIRGESTL